MTTENQKELLNEDYNAILVSGSAVLASKVSKKVLGQPLGTPESVKGTIKLAAAVPVSTMAVTYAEDKK